MKTTIVIYGSSTGTCESVAQNIAAKLGVQAMNVQDMTADTVNNHDNLILGTSTWGAGEMIPQTIVSLTRMLSSAECLSGCLLMRLMKKKRLNNALMNGLRGFLQTCEICAEQQSLAITYFA